ncbi:hypothetical protein SAMN05877809_101543 [Rhodobacter sp. JA431]|uniref:hypothetical protein n=1 Tax=Rhodobacter sp. JA431 TaxID=570013 RepID=UPI000BCCBB7A|nr:hypothetical protein [Rhodobacter sp. JA431]SOB92398.1 hypothetical protein SAMN05877809_101543 [Rhodobacter sp. JA431]
MPFDGQISSSSAATSVSAAMARRATPAAAMAAGGNAQAAESSASKRNTPTEVARMGRSLPTNAAAETLVKAAAEAKTQKTGALAMSKEIGAENLAEMKQREPTPVEQIRKQQAGGKPGATITELTDMIAQSTELGKVDLSQTRPDVTEQLAKQRSITEQSIEASNAEAKANSRVNLAQKMEQRMAEANAENSYSTASLAAVSTQGQGGGAVQVRM